jgi:hypothetical protein
MAYLGRFRSFFELYMAYGNRHDSGRKTYLQLLKHMAYDLF